MFGEAIYNQDDAAQTKTNIALPCVQEAGDAP
jgi:hypothetical protein